MRRWAVAAAVVMLAMVGGAVGEVPDPRTLTSTTGMYWVNHTWQAGATGVGFLLIAGNYTGSFSGFNWTGSMWQNDSEMVSGLTDVGAHSSPTVFQKDATWYLIAGEHSGVFNGFNKTGSIWQSDSGIAGGLPDVGYFSAPTVFQKDSTWYLISGNSTGSFDGFNWTGSMWQGDSGIVGGLTDVEYYSAPTVFQKDSTWYLIAGNVMGSFDGFNWTGSIWQNDSEIVSGLTDVGFVAVPTVFENAGVWYLIAGDDSGSFSGFNWTGSMWQNDSEIVGGLPDVGTYPSPNVFYMATIFPDSYNVSVNDVWHNGTTNTFWNASYSTASWQNITVYAWKDMVSSGNVSQNTRTTGLPPATWWNGDWDYRQRITITNSQSGDLTDSYVEGNVNASQCYWSDCSDMRFIDAVTGLEIDFYCDADIGGFPNNSTSEKIYLKVPEIKANYEAHIDFYFGNINSVPNECSGSGTLEFAEDFQEFDDGDPFLDNWDFSGAGGTGAESYGDDWWFVGCPISSWLDLHYPPNAVFCCDCDVYPTSNVNANLRYGYYGDRYLLIQPEGAAITFEYDATNDYTVEGNAGGSGVLFGCVGTGCEEVVSTYKNNGWTSGNFEGLPSWNWGDGTSTSRTLNIEFSAWAYAPYPIYGTPSRIDDIIFQQTNPYIPPHAVGVVEMRPYPSIVLYDRNKNLVQHARVSLQNLTTGEIVHLWKDVDDGIIDMGTSTDTFQVAVRTFDGVFVHTCDLGANPVCEIILPIHYNVRVYPVDEYEKPLTDVFAGLAEYTPLDPQAFWGYSMTGSLYVPITNCSGFAICDLIVEKGGYESVNITALNWTSRNALVKDYRHTAVMPEEGSGGVGSWWKFW